MRWSPQKFGGRSPPVKPVRESDSHRHEISLRFSGSTGIPSCVRFARCGTKGCWSFVAVEVSPSPGHLSARLWLRRRTNSFNSHAHTATGVKNSFSSFGRSTEPLHPRLGRDGEHRVAEQPLARGELEPLFPSASQASVLNTGPAQRLLRTNQSSGAVNGLDHRRRGHDTEPDQQQHDRNDDAVEHADEEGCRRTFCHRSSS